MSEGPSERRAGRSWPRNTRGCRSSQAASRLLHLAERCATITSTTGQRWSWNACDHFASPCPANALTPEQDSLSPTTTSSAFAKSSSGLRRHSHTDFGPSPPRKRTPHPATRRYRLESIANVATSEELTRPPTNRSVTSQAARETPPSVAITSRYASSAPGARLQCTLPSCLA